ncbi:addiction module protein [Okeania sp. SIO3I5]|uniref:addiction module protein n=1 Tax=Okeania sp. SIO3I5 TaxID=2607805 RepID=UPI0025EDD734|nr:addiction module protein [Okeania sp. SIO3I5]
MTTKLINQILQLNISERLELIENIWNSIADMPNEIELTQTQKQELDYRWELL